MKKALSLFLCFVITFSYASLCSYAVEENYPCFYIDSINGDDSNSGTSEISPWKTIYGHDYIFVPGTKVLFKCGGAYDMTATSLSVDGTKENPIVISSYGEGDRPLLYAKGKENVLTLIDCSYVMVSDVQITAPDGGGIWINTQNEISEGITVDNVKFFGIQNYEVRWRDDLSRGPAYARACIVIKGFPSGSLYPVNNVTISNCEMTDCANGISAWGQCKNSPDVTEDIEAVFNKGLLIENCYFADMDAEAIIVGTNDGAVVRNCVSKRCCLGADEPDENGDVKYFTAAMWYWGSINCVIEHCEISDQKNYGDGMTVDFDSYSNNCTYQYVYSHDNVRFVMNNAKLVPQKGNTVRYCLSVNDGVGSNRVASSKGEDGFNFYNNTIVNCGHFDYSALKNSYVANNIVMPRVGYKVRCDWNTATTGNNTFENNCYYNAINPVCDLGSMNEFPCFAGDDYTKMESFRLAKNSPLIGKGSEIVDGLTKDIFGEEIVSNNIGCYGGAGVDVEGDRSNIFEEIINIFVVLFKILVNDIIDLIND